MLKLKTFQFEFDKKQKSLVRGHNTTFPGSLLVESENTGVTMEFTQVTYGHKFYDEDGWDGEQMVYVPVNPEAVPRVEKLVLYHF